MKQQEKWVVAAGLAKPHIKVFFVLYTTFYLVYNV